MNNQLRLLLALLFSITFSLSAQNTHRCGFDDYWNHQIEQNPHYLENWENIEAFTQRYVEKHRNNVQKAAELITIPVVVHVVHTSNRPESNVSEAKIYSQIEALNQDFRKLNADTSNVTPEFRSLIADIEIEFCLASRDPNGLPSTGITRTETDVQRFFVESDEIKSSETGGKDPWPYEDYLNMWVCYNICSTFGGCGILGYAVPPSFSTPERDGVVIQYSYFGTTPPVSNAFDRGRTAVHEIGHWLNLSHVWGGSGANPNCTGDDFVDDTPIVSGPNYGCPFTPPNTCIDDTLDMVDMTENYMDYSNDACLNMFTIGQKLRMRALFDEGGFRASLKESMGCVPVEQGMDDARLISVGQPNEEDVICSVFQPEFTIQNLGTEPLQFFTVEYELNGEERTYIWGGNIESLKTETITLPSLQINSEDGNNIFLVFVTEPNGREDFNIADNGTVINFQSVPPANKDVSFTESFQTPPGFPFPPIGWGIFNEDNDFNFRFKKSEVVGYGDIESAYMPNFESDASYVGTIDEIFSPSIDFEGEFDSLYLQLFYAYTSMGEGTISDTLEILVSVDCGETYTSVRKFFGEELITADPSAEVFVPMEGQWKEGLVNLIDFKDYRNVNIKVRQIRGSGNDLYVDDINLLSGLTSIEGKSLQNQVSIHTFPNPVRDKTIIELNNLPINENVQLSISNKAGQIVYQQNIRSNSSQLSLEVPVNQLESGMYVVSLNSLHQSSHKKFIVIK